ncbi:DUF4412 domain-containing protein [Plastoroseomonas hellenica]|uniref:DUF4412 domain-containing protein n=1 Tax=Plastoroseomonas hellenica TaxID=2687306 RepID=A0ABS5F511_9PROT|nr:DUF4412 domain-containing protein [Plastoroseomonas hellenica]MBR0644074.1 DUF4412 domain-containing protein [Plastoroseomonas hellenica]MBR0667538.1 DUF4412 domain-containing protein [Plastoroseomonas hellenica]
MRHALAALLLGLPVAALAQPSQPPLFPTRDVAVTYRTSGGPQGAPQDVQMSWLVSQRLMRVDLPAGAQAGPMSGGWMLLDQRNNRAQVVMEQQRMVMNVDGHAVPGGQGFNPSPNARFAREGSERIAGTACTVWRVEDGSNRARACLTDDGVLLRAQNDAQPGQVLEATRVAYGAQDPARFQVPAGFQPLDMQRMMQGIQRGAPPTPPAR